MKKIFNINEEERSRILNLHENATKAHYVHLINEVAAFGAKFPQVNKVILYSKKAGGEVVGAVLPEGTVWTFDGAKATTKTADGLTITYRCDRPAGGVTKGVSFNFTNGSVGLYTQTGALDATLKKTFCETSSVPSPAPKPGPAPVDTKKPNDKVKELQIKLNSLPNVVSVTGSKLTEDGIFGSKTLEAALIALRGDTSMEAIKTKGIPTSVSEPETLATQPESSIKLG